MWYNIQKLALMVWCTGLSIFIYFMYQIRIQLLSSTQFGRNQSVATCHQKLQAEKQWVKSKRFKKMFFKKGAKKQMEDEDKNAPDTLKLMHWLSVFHFLFEDLHSRKPAVRKIDKEQHKWCHKIKCTSMNNWLNSLGLVYCQHNLISLSLL